MKISVARVQKNGGQCYMVSWRPNGEKRNRRFFDTKKAAETEADTLRGQQSRAGEVWMALSAEKRDELIRLVADAEREGYTLGEAVRFYRLHRNTASHPIRLGDAYTRFMDEKKAELLSPKTLGTLKTVVGRFVSGQEGILLNVIKREDVLCWLRRDEWGPRTFNTYLSRLKTFLGWCVKVDYLQKSPAANIEQIDESRMPDLDVPPVVLNVKQAKKLLQATRRLDPGLIPYVAVGLFGGLRPEREAAKLVQGDISDGHIRVLGLHAKDRQRRDVEIHPTLKAWLELGGDMPPKNLRRRFARLRAAAGLVRLEKVKGKGFARVIPTGWAQDCLRHTFASHYLPVFGAEKTIKQLGHGDYSMLFRHYRSLVTEREAKAFWRLKPRAVT